MCTNPWYSPKLGFRVPCGQCMGCRIDRSRMWTERIVHESQYWDSSCFVTLTFRDELSLAPRRWSLDKKVLQDFWKRLRYERGNERLRYYACGEYGDRFGAAHYHAIIFGGEACGECFCCNSDARRRGRPPDDETFCGALVRAWPLGFVHVSGVGPECAGYVAKYVTKFDTRDLGGRVEPFSVMSQGLGARWCFDHWRELWKEVGYRRKGRIVSLPPYYQRYMDRILMPRPEVRGRRLELLSVKSCRTASWFLGRIRWRLADQAEWDRRIRLLGTKRGSWVSLAHLESNERRQSSRNMDSRRVYEGLRG